MDKPSHINPAFDAELADMEEQLAAMEDAVQAQISAAQQALNEMDAGLARDVRKKDKQLNQLAEEVEHKAVTILAKHQPMAEDLRRTIGALKMAIEYERGGDYVKHLAKSIVKLAAHHGNLEVFPSLRTMLEEVGAMFAAYTQARREGNLRAAERVWLQDQRIDDLCSDAVREAFDNQQKGDGNVHSLIQAISVAKNSERLGDKIKNLVEIFYLQKTGEHLDVKVDE